MRGVGVSVTVATLAVGVLLAGCARSDLSKSDKLRCDALSTALANVNAAEAEWNALEGLASASDATISAFGNKFVSANVAKSDDQALRKWAEDGIKVCTGN